MSFFNSCFSRAAKRSRAFWRTIIWHQPAVSLSAPTGGQEANAYRQLPVLAVERFWQRAEIGAGKQLRMLLAAAAFGTKGDNFLKKRGEINVEGMIDLSVRDLGRAEISR